ncbi:MAG: hypothetical protein RJA86_1390, partial [Pseudomonadota bacterium]
GDRQLPEQGDECRGAHRGTNVGGGQNLSPICAGG